MGAVYIFVWLFLALSARACEMYRQTDRQEQGGVYAYITDCLSKPDTCYVVELYSVVVKLMSLLGFP